MTKTLSDDEKVKMCKETWKKPETNADQFADIFYTQLFVIDPSAKPLFKSANMKKQGRKLVKMISLALANIADPEKVESVVRALAVRHVSYGVKEAHFPSVGQALIYALEKENAKEWTPEAKQSWIWLYGSISKTMVAALKEAQQKNDQIKTNK